LSFEEAYKNQVALLLEVLPVLNEFTCFALKGGTAINLCVSTHYPLVIYMAVKYVPL